MKPTGYIGQGETALSTDQLAKTNSLRLPRLFDFMRPYPCVNSNIHFLILLWEGSLDKHASLETNHFQLSPMADPGGGGFGGLSPPSDSKIKSFPRVQWAYTAHHRWFNIHLAPPPQLPKPPPPQLQNLVSAPGVLDVLVAYKPGARFTKRLQLSYSYITSKIYVSQSR